MEEKLIIPQNIYDRIEADALAWSENQYGHDDVNKDYLEGALHEAMIAQAEYVRLSKQGPVWVKASDRLPGWDELVEWRFAGKEPTAKETVRFLSSAANIHQWEWYDEAAASGEREVDIDELWDEHSEHIDDDIDNLSRWAGSTVVDKEQFRTLVAKLYELFKQKQK